MSKISTFLGCKVHGVVTSESKSAFSYCLFLNLNWVLPFCPGLKESAAARKWKELFADQSVKRDQVEAVNAEGLPLGKAQSIALN